MSSEFYADPDPSAELCEKVAALAPANPFYTGAYVEAMRKSGSQPWTLALRQHGQLLSACPAFMKAGRLNRSLEITSLPALPDQDVFWTGLLDFCRRRRVSLLEVGSFASPAATIPVLTGEVGRRTRQEYVLDLEKPDLRAGLASNHLRNVKSAGKAGLQMRRAGDARACLEHAQLVQASMDRRRGRGEAVAEGLETQHYLALTESGAGELFQAVLGDRVLSSILVLLSEAGAYYQSAGTSPEGMSCGASPFLVYEIARTLQAQSIKLFNLGGAEESNPGLQRFKAGFGAKRVQLESAEFFLGSTIQRKLGTAARLLRDDPAALLRQLAGHFERFVVYTAAPHEIAAPEPAGDLILEKLSDEALANPPGQNEELKEQADRFHRLGFNDAYAVYCDGKLAHVAWLVTAEHDRTVPVRNVKLRAGEAEITHCVTLPEFRGKGLYSFAIRSLCGIARERGIRRIYMITGVENVASQRGIEKAGFVRCGRLVRFVSPSLPGLKNLTFREHRWRRGNQEKRRPSGKGALSD